MTSSNYAYRTFDDIVFEGRNREYGAYLLRKVYTRNLWKGLVTAISLFMLFLSIPLLVNKFRPEESIITEPIPTDGTTTFTKVDLPDIEPITPPPAPDAKPPVQEAKAPTERFTPPKIVNNASAQTDVPTQQTLSNSNVGTETVDGEAGVKPPVTTGTEVGTGTGETAPPVFYSADKMPEYPGGMAAMKKFLANNMVYPNRARQMGLEGTVLLSFVVNQNGDISGIQVLKSPGMGIEEEAIRVLKSMPKWSPGMNNGIPVNVRFTLPITFAIR